MLASYAPLAHTFRRFSGRLVARSVVHRSVAERLAPFGQGLIGGTLCQSLEQSGAFHGTMHGKLLHYRHARTAPPSDSDSRMHAEQ